MPIVGNIVPKPESGPRTLYSPPTSENPSDRKGRESPEPIETTYEPARHPISVYYDQETDIELLLAIDGQSVTIRAGQDRLELSGQEWRGLYSGVMNLGPGRETGP